MWGTKSTDCLVCDKGGAEYNVKSINTPKTGEIYGKKIPGQIFNEVRFNDN